MARSPEGCQTRAAPQPGGLPNKSGKDAATPRRRYGALETPASRVHSLPVRGHRRARVVWAGAALTAAALRLFSGCTQPIAVDSPLEALGDPNLSWRKHLGAMQALDVHPVEPDYLTALHEMMWRPGYTPATREEAFERLGRHDVQRLKRTCRQWLPRLGTPAWRARLCELIAENGWFELTPALVSSWARPTGFVDDMERAEYAALVRLHGQDNVIGVVFGILFDPTETSSALRARCWELLNRLGHRDQVISMLTEQPIPAEDGLLGDLRAGAVDLGVVPHTREEILWIQKLREPARAEFYAQASAVVAGLSERRRRTLNVRDLPILVAVSIHDPPLLAASTQELYERLRDRLATARHHIDPDRFEGYPGTYRQRLRGHKQSLTWGDLAAMLLALRAVAVPQVAAHLFDYARRDRVDRSCEYGGVITLDAKGRFEVLEFPPRFRRRDNEFIASQEMLDTAYTAVFHFHNHAQRYRNVRYAGPGIGDVNYADNMRANCLVFTFINAETLNIDFYRHGRVIVDLGEVKLP